MNKYLALGSVSLLILLAGAFRLYLLGLPAVCH